MTDGLKFRIYYASWDGQSGEYRYWTFQGRGFADAINAPTEGVQQIIQENPAKKRGFDIINQKDIYAFRPDQGWIGMDDAGYATYQRETGFPKFVIFGYNLHNAAYEQTLGQALKEGLGA